MKKILSIATLFLSASLMTVSCSSGKKTNDAKHTAKTEVENQRANYKQSATAKGKRTCTNKKDVRYIEVVMSDTGCVVKYTKFGNTTEIAQATKDMGHCDRVSEKTQVNLVESGFTCE